MKTTFQILLLAAGIALTYLCYVSIMDPIQFQEEKGRRDKAVISRLIDIRKAQVEYIKQNKKYTASFDTLIAFVKVAKIPVISKEGNLTDEQLEAGLTEKEAVKKGLIKRDTTWVLMTDTMYAKGFIADSLALIPYSNGKKFAMATGQITAISGQVIPLFEAKATYREYLQGLNKQEIINLNTDAIKLERFPGLQVGSIVEANNNGGNWE